MGEQVDLSVWLTSLTRNNQNYSFICSKPKSPIKVRQKRQRDPKLSSRKPCGHSDAEKKEVATEAESDEFLKITRSFKPYDRVKVQMCSRVDKAVLSPSVQLFEIANEIFACIEHRSFPTTCFANTKLERPKDIKIGDVHTYVNVWKPVLMMEIVTSAVNEGDVVILSNLLVGFTQDSQGRHNYLENFISSKMPYDKDEQCN